MSSPGTLNSHESSVGSNILANALQTAQLTESFLNDSDYNDERFLYLERSLASMQNETYSYTSDIKKLKTQIESLEKELYQFQQYNRRESVEISGIPDNIEQNKLETTIINILRRVGVWNLESYEIAACHRLRRKLGNEHTQRVIVRFTNRKRVFQCLQARKYLRDNIYEHPKMYIHDSLCQKYKDLFEECLKLKENGDLKKIWTYNGIINIKLTENYYERAKKVFHISDIHRYFPDHVTT